MSCRHRDPRRHRRRRHRRTRAGRRRRDHRRGDHARSGPSLDGARELDASGARSRPGFIDIHTHYDAQVFWDPALRPTSYHGVTTVVAGNCGFTIAPTRPEHHDTIVRTLENVEDMDPATLLAGIVWDFETFPEYLDVGHAARDRAQLHRVRRALARSGST